MTKIVTETTTVKPIETASKGQGERAVKLAERIILGATKLAVFAQGLSDEEWERPVSQTDRRTVGVVINHVANMYPAETNAAQAIASGMPVTDLTWEVITGINAKHFEANPTVERAATLELLRRNSRESAETISQFTDEQLDTAAPFGLSYEAPVTAQFVIEDHALRHSWHHLAKIRKALGR